MRDDFTVEIAGRTLEYIDETHTYLVDGVIAPSITSLVKRRLGDRYPNVPKSVLQRAADRGTEIHAAIERYCKDGTIDRDEVMNFRTLTKVYGIIVKANEVPVILFDGDPIAAGRLDLVIDQCGQTGIADIKTTASLDREYLAAQLNLYARAYEQSYGQRVEQIAGIHLRDDTYKLVQFPLDPAFTDGLIKEMQNDKHDDWETP